MKQCSLLNNYYPFGLPEEGRSWSYKGNIIPASESKYNDYTYGYNGMQRDNSKGLGSGYTTLFREYDPEIARWKSLDPNLLINIDINDNSNQKTVKF